MAQSKTLGFFRSEPATEIRSAIRDLTCTLYLKTSGSKGMSQLQYLRYNFQVESSRWSKHTGAVAGVDYLAPPAAWKILSNTMTAKEREEAWKAFEKRPLSPSELASLREMNISRGKETGTVGARIAAWWSSSGVCGTLPGSTTTSDSSSMETLFSEDVNEFPFATESPNMGVRSEAQSPRERHPARRHTSTESQQFSRQSDEIISSTGDRWSDKESMIHTRSGTPAPQTQLGLTQVKDADHGEKPVHRVSDLGIGASAFSLRGEADLNAVMRAMLHLSKTCPTEGSPNTTGANTVDIDTSGSKPKRHDDFDGQSSRARKHGDAAGARRGQSAPAKEVTYRGELSRGNTPAVKHHQRRRIDPVRTSNHDAAENIGGVSGRMLSYPTSGGTRSSGRSRHGRTAGSGYLDATDSFGPAKSDSGRYKRRRPFTDGVFQGLQASVSVPNMPLGDYRDPGRISRTSLSEHMSSICIAATCPTYLAASTASRSRPMSYNIRAADSMTSAPSLGEEIAQPCSPLGSRASTAIPSDQPRGSGTRMVTSGLSRPSPSSRGGRSKRKGDGSRKSSTPLPQQDSKEGIVLEEHPQMTTSRRELTQPSRSTESTDYMEPSGTPDVSQNHENPLKSTGDVKNASVKEVYTLHASPDTTDASDSPTRGKENSSRSLAPHSNKNGVVEVDNTASSDGPAASGPPKVTSDAQHNRDPEDENEENRRRAPSIKKRVGEAKPADGEQSGSQQALPILKPAANRTGQGTPPNNTGSSKGRRVHAAISSSTSSTASNTGTSSYRGTFASSRSKSGSVRSGVKPNGESLKGQLEESSGQETMGSLTSRESFASNNRSNTSQVTKSTKGTKSTKSTRESSRGQGSKVEPNGRNIPKRSRKPKALPPKPDAAPLTSAVAATDGGDKAQANELPQIKKHGQRTRKPAASSATGRSTTGAESRTATASAATGAI